MTSLPPPDSTAGQTPSSSDAETKQGGTESSETSPAPVPVPISVVEIFFGLPSHCSLPFPTILPVADLPQELDLKQREVDALKERAKRLETITPDVIEAEDPESALHDLLMEWVEEDPSLVASPFSPYAATLSSLQSHRSSSKKSKKKK